MQDNPKDIDLTPIPWSESSLNRNKVVSEPPLPDIDFSFKAPDVPWADLSYKFDGQWMPDVDSSLIGPSNYQTLQNLRYIDDGLECVAGYTKVNPTSVGSTTTIRNGHQLRSNKTQTSYTLIQRIDNSSGVGVVHCSRVTPGVVSTTEFDYYAGGTAHPLDTAGNEYDADPSVNLQGRFSDAPQGNIAYCNGEESKIFGGDEQPVAACFSVKESLGSEIITDSHNSDFSDTNEWANGAGAAALDSFNSSGDLSITSSDKDDYCTLPVANATTVVGTRYRLSVDVSGTVDYNHAWLIKSFDGTQTLAWVYQTGTQLTYDFVAETTGGFRIQQVSWYATSTANFDNFSLKSFVLENQYDVTDKVTTTLSSTSDDYFTIDADNSNSMYVFTTRPIQALKIYLARTNTTPASLSVNTWDGSGWSEDIINVDGTDSGGETLYQTGVVTLDSHTDTISKPMHFEELYLYAYNVTLSASDADIYHITVDSALQNIKDVWDGVYRQPIQFQVLDGTSYFDYTLQVQESSDLNAPVGALLDGLTSSDKLYIMFEDKMSAIKFTMLGDLVNEAASTMSVKYFNGTGYANISITDNTLDTAGTDTLSKTGLVSWGELAGEEPQTLFGSFGYVYEISFSGTLTGTKGTTDIELVVDICTGIPSQLTVPAFEWSAIYGNRLMLGSFAVGNELNRMDYSVANGPDVWNGFDSSDNGKQSLYFGGNEKIVAGTQIYNRFGANVYSMLLVLKQSEVYILVGDTPEEFSIYPVAKTIGCVAPLTLDTAEIGIDLGGGLTRNVAMWLSHSGPMMFDGAVLVPIRGIDSYFDPTDSRYVNFSLMDQAAGWFDSEHKEYNICIPSGSGATSNNTWLVFDLARRKWYEKVCLSGHYPQCGFNVMNPATGKKYIYAGKSDGFMVQLETGTYWDDGSATGIAQSVTTGDFYPSNNMWDITVLRKHKLLLKKVAEVSEVTNTATIKHYTDTTTTSSTVGTVDLSSASGNNKLVRVVDNLNKKGVQHAFNYSVTTTNVDKGFQPVAWGVQYRPERKDNTAT